MEYEFKTRTILEIVGKPKKHIEDTLKEYISAIEKDEKYAIVTKKQKRAKKVEGDLYSVFADLEVRMKDFASILDFAIDYMPASIEIEEPTGVSLTNADASNIVNDMLARLHQVDMTAKSLNQKNRILGKSMGILIQNAILILLNLGPKTKPQIAKYIGISEEQLPVFLQKLIDDAKIVQEGEKYRLEA